MLDLCATSKSNELVELQYSNSSLVQCSLSPNTSVSREFGFKISLNISIISGVACTMLFAAVDNVKASGWCVSTSIAKKVFRVLIAFSFCLLLYLRHCLFE